MKYLILNEPAINVSITIHTFSLARCNKQTNAMGTLRFSAICLDSLSGKCLTISWKECAPDTLFLLDLDLSVAFSSSAVSYGIFKNKVSLK